MYDEGEGVPQDDREAVKWFRLAAEQGAARAQFNLGIMYADGEGVPQDDKEAVKWFRLAAEHARVHASSLYLPISSISFDSISAFTFARPRSR